MTDDLLLALDVGGTRTQAVIVDRSRRVHGYGRAGAGNPTAVGIPAAVAAIELAAAQALGLPPTATAADPGPTTVHDLPDRRIPAVLAMAGEKTTAFRALVESRLARLGVAPVTLGHDLLAVFCSGTSEPTGYALIAGTGSVAARVFDGRLERVVGGRGWLLGDAGSGFWLGQAAARAVVAALDGQGRDTALVDLVLDRLGIPARVETVDAREQTVRKLLSAVYAEPPVGLAALAPLVFSVPDDPVAAAILEAGAAALAELLRGVRLPGRSGPVVVGGSVVVRGWLGGAPDVARRLDLGVPPAGLVTVPDGLVGAAVIALRDAGTAVEAADHAALAAAITTMKHSMRPPEVGQAEPGER